MNLLDLDPLEGGTLISIEKSWNFDLKWIKDENSEDKNTDLS